MILSGFNSNALRWATFFAEKLLEILRLLGFSAERTWGGNLCYQIANFAILIHPSAAWEGIWEVAKKFWQPKVWLRNIGAFLRFSFGVPKTRCFSSLLVRSYFLFFCGPWFKSFKLLRFAVIHPLGWLFRKEWPWNVIPRWQMSLHNFQRELNGWRCEPFLRSV